MQRAMSLSALPSAVRPARSVQIIRPARPALVALARAGGTIFGEVFFVLAGGGVLVAGALLFR